MNNVRCKQRNASHGPETSKKRILLFAAAAAIFSAIFASNAADPSEKPAPQPTVRQIVEQQTQLREQVAGKRGAFKEMHEGDRHRLLEQQNRLLQMLDGRLNFDELRAEERVEAFNILQNVNAAATKAEDERTICERTRQVGSHRYSTVCMTGKQYREHKENAKQSARTVMKCQPSESDTSACGKN